MTAQAKAALVRARMVSGGKGVEASTGIEPVFTDLQSGA